MGGAHLELQLRAPSRAWTNLRCFLLAVDHLTRLVEALSFLLEQLDFTAAHPLLGVRYTATGFGLNHALDHPSRIAHKPIARREWVPIL